MGSRSAGAAAVENVASSAVVALWYAMPDVVRSRAWRAGLKVAILGVAAGYSAVRYREAAEAAGRGDDDALVQDGPDGTAARVRRLIATTPVIDVTDLDLDLSDDDARAGTDLLRAGGFAALATAGLAAVAAGTVAAERGLFRLGERWRAQGRPGAHTRIGLVAGVATAALALVADELERRVTPTH